MVIVLVVTATLAIAGCGALTVLARSYVAKPGPATAVVDPRNGQLIESEVIAHQRPETPV